jgi:hypothetical protein
MGSNEPNSMDGLYRVRWTVQLNES